MAVFLLPTVAFLLLTFLLPLLLVIQTSLSNPDFTVAHYEEIFAEPLYAIVLGNTAHISILSTLLALLLGYPIAYHLARQPPRRRALLLMLVLLPFWTSILVKSFSFTILLGQSGVLNTGLQYILGEGATIKLLFNRPGVIIGMTHFLLPFMVFTILSSLLAQDPDLRRAAEIMGAGRIRIFWSITLPLSMPGVLAGVLICVILAMGMFITPALLGGRGDLMISSLVELNVRETLNWNLASALAVCLIVLTAALTLALARVRGGQLLDSSH